MADLKQSGHVHPPQLARGIHIFRANTPAPRSQPRTRAKLTREEREKVREVRRQGACLRCKILKIQCSKDNPCQSCLSSAVKGSERKVLSFCYCVRTRFADVNIFHKGSSDSAGTMQIENAMSRIGVLLSRIALPASFSLDDKNSFNDTLVSWLTNPAFSFPSGSIVGLCCSSLLSIQFQEAVGSDLITEFRRFLLATSLVRNGWCGRDMGRQDLCVAGHVTGFRLVNRLDRVLTPQFLAKCSPESCQVLFLLVLGTVLGVGYSGHDVTADSPRFPPEMLAAEFQQSPTLWLAMKEHLCQMLAHHLIYLGSMLGIKLDTGLEQHIIDTAVKRWNKLESFIWSDVLSQDPQPPPLPPPSAAARRFEPHQEPPSYSHWSEEYGPPLVSVQCPEVAGLHNLGQFSENPESYLSMLDEIPHIHDLPGQEAASEGIRSTPRAAMTREAEFEQDHVPWRKVKRRSMWLVRSFDAGENGLINVHARLRGREVNDMGLFV
ncbi:hypothetical protein QBC46DRAFT_267354 [Diplogelasinospora grovesii]|uniref:Zn(2)-C6 fungal-type domain-containing protein n=1 Tax=Diplogelasinospora grovesii TaxID=303347 RepID=A0AAN6N1M8_9PEZI|nr:hypothetical protein QBC46DRAFT_267354 [Diplogelasinospora grovesii]